MGKTKFKRLTCLNCSWSWVAPKSILKGGGMVGVMAGDLGAMAAANVSATLAATCKNCGSVGYANVVDV